MTTSNGHTVQMVESRRRNNGYVTLSTSPHAYGPPLTCLLVGGAAGKHPWVTEEASSQATWEP